MIIDAHVRIGASREAALSVAELLSTMDSVGIDRALVAPSEREIAYDNVSGNAVTAAAARESSGRLLPYAVANPWREDAVEVVRVAADAGAVALAVDPVLQGFDLLDGLIEPLLAFAAEQDWLVYVRTGTPPTARCRCRSRRWLAAIRSSVF
ncbi:amidohydrolase family protein [Fodinicola feengrottensis]|uniref:amidohydrolase family protein n=1 Tax=Fodinicola feengrottensis TaxID=435914 RepID=UPI002442BB5F|nr:amidohydrolase family protein [Fodinicola feengrottensis]